jgi:hypothetical protein
MIGGHAARVQRPEGHDVVGCAVFSTQYPAGRAVALVYLAEVADDRRLAGALAALVPGSVAAGRDEGVYLNAADYSLAAVVQGVMVYAAGYENGIAGFNRIFFAIADQRAGSFDDIHLVLPGVNVMGAGLIGINLRVGHGAGRRVILQPDEPGCRPLRRINIPEVSDYWFQSSSLLIFVGR